MPRQPQSEEQRDSVQRRILSAAQDLFDAAGIEAVSMRALGARVGLSASALYAYFPTKRDLLRALWWDAVSELHLRMQNISDSEPDPVAAIRAIGRAYAEFAAENPVRFNVLFIIDQGELAEELKSSGVRAAAYELFRQRVAEAIERGRLRPGDPDLAAQTLWAGIHGVLTLTSSSASFPFLPSTLLIDTVMEAILAGLNTTSIDERAGGKAVRVKAVVRKVHGPTPDGHSRHTGTSSEG
ncbi:AcrR family transcriptional regulator [Azospirillum lipoferum]|uniref:TetR/AcrR family transcriptional regulator n=1 Tax=Azospirillum lipoferum TaxID=193 RepID=A0A5A9GFB2_AZOLI|nr:MULTISPECIES: TetR/AcrR family transcriptional regulator [Azospirillum]KAA0593007.1 TetR/AcrR family transcriptional regulator [Azospirillum lipoferum]MCP1613931.1 AcrR family transcriptional regulator [Azospirillum lipoferum]MDW5537675.1 TetR/AcrR family transcriptional regulator [Azospirillum sp. NL1]